MRIPLARFDNVASITDRTPRAPDNSTTYVIDNPAGQTDCSFAGFVYLTIYFKLAGRRRPAVKARYPVI